MSIAKREWIEFEVIKNVGVLSISRESKLNALNSEVLYNMSEGLSEIKELNINALVLTGGGEKSFIAGADIGEMANLSTKEAELFGQLGQDVTVLLESLSFPVIAAVQGFALGGGCEMALSCDFIYATPNAIFGQPETKLGLIPGYGGTQRLTRKIGRTRSKELIFTGRNLKVDEAKEMGLVVRIFPTKQDIINHVIKTFGEGTLVSPYAVKQAKVAIDCGIEKNLESGLKTELDRFGNIFSSQDMREGCKAFLEKRNPQFTGN